MFITTKNNLVDFVDKLQRTWCCYDMYSYNENSKPPSFCDCKYGRNNFKENVLQTGTEKTGCPELRCLSLLLKGISNKKYIKIMKKMEGFLIC